MKRVRVSRIVLVGLPGAGKSTVGPLLARELGFDFIDVDAEIERDTGLDIPAIFRARGEAGFRDIERRVLDRVVMAEDVVVAPGGGWAAQPGAMKGLPDDSVVVWLQVSVGDATHRLEGETGARPLLDAADLAARLAEIEGERLLAYSAAGIVVDTTDRTPEAVTTDVVARLHSEYGIDGEAD